MTTPSQELAARIAQRLVKEGLLLEADVKRLQPGIADGSASTADWRVAIEKASPGGRQNER